MLLLFTYGFVSACHVAESAFSGAAAPIPSSALSAATRHGPERLIRKEMVPPLSLAELGGSEDPSNEMAPARRRRVDMGDISSVNRTCDGKPVFSPKGTCPASCPYTAETNGTGVMGCMFRCVRMEQCGGEGLRSFESYADAKTQTCRRCNKRGCERCRHGTEECNVCIPGYVLTQKGVCEARTKIIWVAISYSFLIIGFVLVLWMIELSLRPVSNKEGALHGQSFRARAVVTMPRDTPDGVGVRQKCSPLQLYPLTANLLSNSFVGGTGLCLHMRFQVFVIIWAFVLGVVYVGVAQVFATDLLDLGTRKWQGTTQLCSVVRDGAGKDFELSFIRLMYAAFAYFFTFVSSLVFGLWNELVFQSLDSEESSMKDFVARLDGLPELEGTVQAEKTLTDLIKDTTQTKIVGVSICWDYKDVEETVMHVHEQIMEELETITDEKWQTPLEKPLGASPTWHPWDEGGPRCFKALFSTLDKYWRVYLLGIPMELPDEMDKDGIKMLLEDMKSSSTAFAVFETEAERDIAIQKFNSSKVTLRDEPLTLKKKDIEPGTVKWANFRGKNTATRKVSRLLIAIAGILALIVGWSRLVYLPVCQMMVGDGTPLSFSEPEFWLLTAVVILGNQIMYVVGDIASVFIGFETEDSRQSCYGVLYGLAVFLVVFVDISINGHLTYLDLKRKGVHTADGRLIGELTHVQEIIQSFPMQASLGNVLFRYCWPLTFLFPFVMEGVAAIGLFKFIGNALVNSRPEMRGRKAERALWFFLEMNMCRYSDVVLNALLASLVFFVGGGYTHKLFLLMAASHVYLYIYDTWRILRATPTFNYSSQFVDRCGQYLMIMPCAIILASVIFRVEEIYRPDAAFHFLIVRVFWCVVFHCAVHGFLLSYVVPKIGRLPHTQCEGKYESIAKTSPASFFSLNPVHCLRSKYFYEHQIPCSFFQPGKEYLMWANPDVGQYFETGERPNPYKLEASSQPWYEDASVTITSITHPAHGDSGEYFFFDKAAWSSMVGSTTWSGKTFRVAQSRGGRELPPCQVTVWDDYVGVHGHRKSDSACRQWEVGDILAVLGDIDELDKIAGSDLSGIGEAVRQALQKKHLIHVNVCWSLTYGKVVGDVVQTPSRCFWGNVNDMAKNQASHAKALLERMRDFILKAQLWVDISTLCPPTGAFHQMLVNAIKELAERRAEVTIRILFGNILGTPVDCDSIMKSLTEALPNNGVVRLWVGAWRNHNSWNNSNLIAIDGKHLLTGSIRLLEQDYLSKYPVHDLSVEVEGRVAYSGHCFLNKMWQWMANQHMKKVKQHLMDPKTPIVMHNRVEIAHWPHTEQSTAPMYDAEPESLMKLSHALSTQHVPIITCGRYGGIHTRPDAANPSKTAIISMLENATKSIKMSLQDLGPLTFSLGGDGPLPIPDGVWPKEYLLALATALDKAVEVHIVLSQPLAYVGSNFYGSGWSCNDIAAEILKSLGDKVQSFIGEAEEKHPLTERLKITFLRAERQRSEWPDKTKFSNHASVVIVDDVCYYIGSEELVSTEQLHIDPEHEANYKFKPGKMGITYDDKGFVKEISPASYAHAKHISEGSQIVKVGIEAFSKDAVDRAEKSGADYDVTFKVTHAELADWGLIVDSEAETQKLLASYWQPMWEQSYTETDLDLKEVKAGLDVNRSRFESSLANVDDVVLLAMKARRAKRHGHGCCLQVRLKYAENIVARNRYDGIDAFIELTVKDKEKTPVAVQTSSTKLNAGSKPTWDEDILLEGIYTPSECTLQVKVFDKVEKGLIDKVELHKGCIELDTLRMTTKFTNAEVVVDERDDRISKNKSMEVKGVPKVFVALSTLGGWGLEK